MLRREVFTEIAAKQAEFDSALGEAVAGLFADLGLVGAIAERIVGNDTFKGLAYLRFSSYAVRQRRIGADGTLLEIFLEWLSNGGFEMIIELIMLFLNLSV